MAKSRKHRNIQERNPELTQKVQNRRNIQASNKAQRKAINEANRILAEAAKNGQPEVADIPEEVVEAVLPDVAAPIIDYATMFTKTQVAKMTLIVMNHLGFDPLKVVAQPVVEALDIPEPAVEIVEPVIMTAVDPVQTAIDAFMIDHPGAELTIEQKPVLDRMPVIKDHPVCTCGLGMGAYGCCQQTAEPYPGL